MDSGSRVRLVSVMGGKVRLGPRDATLIACASSELCGHCRDVQELCEALARVEGWSPVRVRYWLGRLWGEGLVANGTTDLTIDGWIVFRGLRGLESRRELEFRAAVYQRLNCGEMPMDDAVIWLEAVA